MVHDRNEGMLRKAIKGICSMTLLLFLFLFVFFLFPGLVICMMLVISIPFVLRIRPKTEES